MYNSIIWGEGVDEELDLEKANTTSVFDTLIRNTVIKSKKDYLKMPLVNIDPRFKVTGSKNTNYHLDSISKIRQRGMYMPFVKDDMDDLNRSATPDPGCYESKY